MFSGQFFQQEERINILKSIKSMLQQQIINLKSAMGTSISNIKEFEQYRRRMSLRVGSVLVVEN